MATIAFRSLISASFNHTYFANGKLERISVLADADTQKKMNNLSLLFRLSGNTFNILFQDTPVGAPRRTMPGRLTFSFNPLDILFNNYTALPIQDKNKGIFYFSDSPANPEKKNGSLSLGPIVGAADLLLLKPLSFSFSVQGIAIKSGMVLNLVYKPANAVVKTLPVAVSGAAVQVQIHPNPPGRYLLTLGSKTLLDFYASDEFYRQQPLGIIEFLNAAAYAGSSGSPADFTLNFTTRSTFWKYFIISKKNDTPFNNLAIFDATSSADTGLFAHLEDTKLVDGSVASVFVSNSQIPFGEIPGQKFKLVTWQSNELNQFVLIKVLPNASPSLIKPEASEKTEKVYTEIYVYV